MPSDAGRSFVLPTSVITIIRCFRVRCGGTYSSVTFLIVQEVLRGGAVRSRPTRFNMDR